MQSLFDSYDDDDETIDQIHPLWHEPHGVACGCILVEALGLVKIQAGRYCVWSCAVVEALAGAEEEAAL